MIELCPIGVIHVDVKDDDLQRKGSAEGVIEIYDEFKEGLHLLEGFSHLILLTFLNKVDAEARKVLKVRFRRLQQSGVPVELLPEVGIFASDSPHRPNPIGLTIVRVTEIKGKAIYVSGLDVYDGTPVLDIKPYTPFRRIEVVEVPEWFSKIASYVKREP